MGLGFWQVVSMGAILGGIEAQWFPDMGLGFWQVVSMGAILGGTMRSPLMSIVFVLELTHDINLLLPLLLAVTLAHAATVLFLKRSILTEKVSRRGFHLTREYATDPLEILFAREIMATDVKAIPVGSRRQDIAAAINGERRRQSVFAVVDEKGDLAGVVTRWMLEQWSEDDGDNAANDSVLSIAHQPITAFPDESLRAVMNRMAETGMTSLPVVKRDNPRQMVGNITLRDMLKARMKHIEEEKRRERPLPLSLMVPGWLRRSPGIPPSGQLVSTPPGALESERRAG
jgi:CBS domain-containing protein